MTIDDILPVAPRHLLLANAVIWGAPGIKVLVTGIRSYLALWSTSGWSTLDTWVKKFIGVFKKRENKGNQ